MIALVAKGISALATTALMTACALRASLPKTATLEDRLVAIPIRGLPLRSKTLIHWEAHQIPFVEAQSDEDAARALGLIHAHLRLGQMEMLRRIAQGRLAELLGPLGIEIDHGLRMLNLAKATENIEAALPSDTRAWLTGFVQGINHYQQNVEQLPPEFRVLGLERDPWTIRDILTIGRLAGADVNWLVWFNLLRLYGRKDWPNLWARLVENLDAASPDAVAGERAKLGPLLTGCSRSGSNSLAVAGARTRHGGAIMASDPHLGIYLPNLWLIAGVRSPSYHVVGLMIPALPVFGIGRNPWIAWGGTNLRAASSDLYDVAGLSPKQITTRRETIRTRCWRDRTVVIRETPLGPILSDAPQLKGLDLKDFALRWVGHGASDELTALLNVSRARCFEEFRTAFQSFGVPGQTMLYADRDGNIGRVMAAQLPHRSGKAPHDIFLDPDTSDNTWQSLRNATHLPYSLNPEAGFLASANNRPAENATRIGYFFSPDDRVNRMATLLGDIAEVDVEDIKALQQDVYMESSRALCDALLSKLDELGLSTEAVGKNRDVLTLLKGWNGYYEKDSRGALAFELFREGFARCFYQVSFGEQDWAAFANVSRIQTILFEDIERAEPQVLARSLKTALERAAQRLDAFANWGDMHRLRLSHPLAALPIVGARYRFMDSPAGGSTDTLMKTSHRTTAARHATGYGSTARHISDLSDIDCNHFVLLGGQDGWLNSTTFLDQVPLWSEGGYIQLPLSLDKVRAQSVHTTELDP